ncbi:hypothetical protein O1L44_02810 [Streptomyces noursei]|uniref:hypothetical protein n=1 Tax=Streptomyces noursei TaxID=1971 RepID=UPI00081CCC3D|nr:hypothetical protein SNOUR_07895 [Streptomyces noursei ATCC 11455]MCZ0992292.1 hypothetical protein [Streptomyces noursei]
MTYDQDWDRRLNPFRYNDDGSLTDVAKRQNVAMELNSAESRGDGGAGSGGRQTSVRTVALTKAAKALEDLRGDTDKVDQPALSETDVASSALGGWQSSQGLSALHKRWADESVHLSTMLSDAVMKLHNTSSSYERTDRSEKSRMDALDGGRH